MQFNYMKIKVKKKIETITRSKLHSCAESAVTNTENDGHNLFSNHINVSTNNIKR